ncbi:MAG: MerR family transcriptional regulator, partial [Rhodobacteraceae bacterium]|nr:MerR family transcriptional regulator [Paracoccaceae bacterium]
ANQRVYDETDIQRMSFIRHGRALGFSLQDWQN